jgi:hypothetical protein
MSIRADSKLRKEDERENCLSGHNSFEEMVICEQLEEGESY